MNSGEESGFLFRAAAGNGALHVALHVSNCVTQLNSNIIEIVTILVYFVLTNILFFKCV